MSRRVMYEGFDSLNSALYNIEADEQFEEELALLHELKLAARTKKDRANLKDLVRGDEELAYAAWGA